MITPSNKNDSYFTKSRYRRALFYSSRKTSRIKALILRNRHSGFDKFIHFLISFTAIFDKRHVVSGLS